MQNLGDDLRSLNNGCSRAIEEFISVSEKDSTALHRTEFKPIRQRLENGNFDQGSLQIKTARRNDQKIWIRFADVLPRNRGGMLAFVAEEQVPVRRLDQLRRPIARGKNWIGPFQNHEGRCRSLLNTFVNVIQPLLHLCHKVLGCISAIYGAPDPTNVFVNSVDRAGA